MIWPGQENNEYKLIQNSFDNLHKRSVSSFSNRPVTDNKSMDNRMYCEVSVSHDKRAPAKQYQHSGSFPYPRVEPNSRHYWSHNSLENRNLIVNVQVMGKKQEIITYQSNCGLLFFNNFIGFKDPSSNHANFKSNNYVLAWSEDRESQTHRDNSKESLSYDYNVNQKSKHK